MKESKRKIIKEKASDMAHVDCYYLPKSLLLNDNRRYYLVGVVLIVLNRYYDDSY